ncbi:long-chain fatty acid--CoA ligase [Streptomyces subrutilus]|uniref:Long-chain fatty acid--CoA ligase n=1 Tax=Streptomyces subrutilus TaxID=36818 RepID=A0A5P2UW42_9ACTN|nr:long-chain fatty acid--CoA ligase [Streptomyces subrutilus]
MGMDADIVRPLPELLREHARSIGEKVAFEDRRTRLTYRELERRTGRLAGHLAGLGAVRDERAAILLGNRVEAVESLLAVTRASAIGVPLDAGSSEGGAGPPAGRQRRPRGRHRPRPADPAAAAAGGAPRSDRGTGRGRRGERAGAGRVPGAARRRRRPAALRGPGGHGTGNARAGRPRAGRGGLAALHLRFLRRPQGRAEHTAQPPRARGRRTRRCPRHVPAGPAAVAPAAAPRHEPGGLRGGSGRHRGERHHPAQVHGGGGARRTPPYGRPPHPPRRRADHLLRPARRRARRGRHRPGHTRPARVRQRRRLGGAGVPAGVRGGLPRPLPGALRQYRGGPRHHGGPGRRHGGGDGWAARDSPRSPRRRVSRSSTRPSAAPTRPRWRPASPRPS